ncbi:hypothetical protein AB0C04_03290 [Micromonospora sp. NPDC048909]|uniref:hypothetical protein n=1 Tax=Micromonospora sp. NPDC048909 TaxID=3155643 RepID=UPI0033D59832
MSRELDSFYRSLAEDADEQVLTPPDALRRRADRRARARGTVTALAAAVLVVATAAGSQLVLTANQGAQVVTPGSTPSVSTPSATTTPSPTATTSPSPVDPTGLATTPSAGKPPTNRSEAPDTPTSIPDRAFFTQPAGTVASPPAFVFEDALPKLCGARYPSDESLVQRRTKKLVYRKPDTPEGHVPDGSYLHSITIYRSGKAAAWMGDLRRAVQNCPEQERVEGVVSRQRLLNSGDFGDDSVLFEMSEPARDVNGDPTGGNTVRLIRAIRIGDVVTVLWEQGWEGTSSERSQVDDYSRRAVTAIRRWLG